MAAQNQKLRSLSLGDFRTLAYAMLTDAAMLRWLDAQTNTAKAPNENLAREFMELFTLGHGNGYTEDDVREGARALTGWVIRPGGEDHRWCPGATIATAKTMFGVTRNFDAAGFCDIVLAQPKSPQYVAGRLWQQLASDTPPSPQALDRLVAAYGPRRDLRALTRAILTDDEFVSSRAAIVNTPVEWLVGVIRTLRVPRRQPGADEDGRRHAARRWGSDRFTHRMSAGGRTAGSGCRPPAPTCGCAPRANWPAPVTCPASKTPPPTTGSMPSAI